MLTEIKARQDKTTRQDKAKQDETRQEKSRQRTTQHKTTQDILTGMKDEDMMANMNAIRNLAMLTNLSGPKE